MCLCNVSYSVVSHHMVLCPGQSLLPATHQIVKLYHIVSLCIMSCCITSRVVVRVHLIPDSFVLCHIQYQLPQHLNASSAATLRSFSKVMLAKTCSTLVQRCWWAREREPKRRHLSPHPDIHSSSCHGKATQRAPPRLQWEVRWLGCSWHEGQTIRALQAPRHRRGDSAPWFACHSISPGEAYGMTRSAPLTWLFIQFAQTWEWARCPGRPLPTPHSHFH